MFSQVALNKVTSNKQVASDVLASLLLASQIVVHPGVRVEVLRCCVTERVLKQCREDLPTPGERKWFLDSGEVNAL